MCHLVHFLLGAFSLNKIIKINDRQHSIFKICISERPGDNWPLYFDLGLRTRTWTGNCKCAGGGGLYTLAWD